MGAESTRATFGYGNPSWMYLRGKHLKIKRNPARGVGIKRNSAGYTDNSTTIEYCPGFYQIKE